MKAALRARARSFGVTRFRVEIEDLGGDSRRGPTLFH